MIINCLGVYYIDEIIGKTDCDFLPPHIAKQFIRDDEKVLAGKDITQRLEINMTQLFTCTLFLISLNMTNGMF